MSEEHSLWQKIEKRHIEIMTKETISDEEWITFVEQHEHAFAEEASILAETYWNERQMYS